MNQKITAVNLNFCSRYSMGECGGHIDCDRFVVGGTFIVFGAEGGSQGKSIHRITTCYDEPADVTLLDKDEQIIAIIPWHSVGWLEYE